MIDLVELVGYAGTALTVAAYAMRSTTSLRIASVASSVAFITYGWFAVSYPVMVMELILLPLNLLRLWQMRRLVRAVVETKGSAGDLSWIAPFAQRQSFRAGATVTNYGDPADTLRLILSGSVRSELGGVLETGRLAGDALPFCDGATESTTLVAVEDTVIATLPCSTLRELFLESPTFGYRLARLVLSDRRLIQPSLPPVVLIELNKPAALIARG